MSEILPESKPRIPKGKIIGIDLGTTFSLVAEYNPITKQATVIPLDAGPVTMPSAVYYPPQGDPIVGQEAINAGEYDAERLVRFIKMQMGTEFRKTIGDRDYSPAEVSSEILKKLKKSAETYLNIGPDGFDSVVITVPAYFGEKSCAATLEAARLAGFDMDENKLRLFNEPCAAAVAYVAEARLNLSDRPRLIAVSDLGGGTYDATIIETRPAVAEDGRLHLAVDIVSKAGNQQLGGVMWDQDLEEHVQAQCTAAATAGHSPGWAEPSLAHQLRERVIRGKELLTRTSPVKIFCCTGKNQEIDVPTFEQVTAGRLAEVEHVLRTLWDEERQRQEQQVADGQRQLVQSPDMVLLAGGASNMPQIRRLVEEITGQRPQVHRTLEQIVGLGAAYEAAILCGLEVFTGGDVEGGISIERSLGIVTLHIGIKALNPETGEHENVVVLPKGTKQGKETSRDDLTPADPDQRAVRFVLLEGGARFQEPTDGLPIAINELASDCVELGNAMLELPPREAEVRLRVQLSLGENYTVVGRGIAYKVVQEKEVIIGEVPLRIVRRRV